jgi:hypothetical protein
LSACASGISPGLSQSLHLNSIEVGDGVGVTSASGTQYPIGAVPEPATPLLWLAVLMVLVAMRRKRGRTTCR